MKKRISKKHSLTFLPQVWDDMVSDAKKADKSVSKFISDLYTKSKDTMKSLILSIAILTILSSCSKTQDPTPVKRGNFKMEYSATATNNFAFDTEIKISFGTLSNGGKTSNYNYEDTKTFKSYQVKSLTFILDTVVTADIVNISIVSKSLRDNPKVKYSYNDKELFNSTIDYSQVSSGYSKYLNF